MFKIVASLTIISYDCNMFTVQATAQITPWLKNKNLYILKNTTDLELIFDN